MVHCFREFGGAIDALFCTFLNPFRGEGEGEFDIGFFLRGLESKIEGGGREEEKGCGIEGFLLLLLISGFSFDFGRLLGEYS